MLAYLVESFYEEINDSNVPMWTVTDVPWLYSRWILVYHTRLMIFWRFNLHIATPNIFFEELIELSVWSARIVLTGDEMKVVAPHVVCHVQQSQSTLYLCVSSMRYLHTLVALKEEYIRILLFTRLY